MAGSEDTCIYWEWRIWRFSRPWTVGDLTVKFPTKFFQKRQMSGVCRGRVSGAGGGVRVLGFDWYNYYERKRTRKGVQMVLVKGCAKSLVYKIEESCNLHFSLSCLGVVSFAGSMRGSQDGRAWRLRASKTTAHVPYPHFHASWLNLNVTMEDDMSLSWYIS